MIKLVVYCPALSYVGLIVSVVSKLGSGSMPTDLQTTHLVLLP